MLSILSYITLLSDAALDLILGFGDHFGILGLCEMGKKGTEGGMTTPGHCSGWRCGGWRCWWPLLLPFGYVWTSLPGELRDGFKSWHIAKDSRHCGEVWGCPMQCPTEGISVGLAAVTQHPGTPPLSQLAAKANLDGGRILADPLSQF